MEFIFLIAMMVLLLWWMSHSAKKQQARAREQRDAAIVLGAHVVTHSGFFGTVVDVDGDAVTLESPSGIETVWLRSSIAQAMDIPVAAISEEEAREDDRASEDVSTAEGTEGSVQDAEDMATQPDIPDIASSASNDAEDSEEIKAKGK